MKAKTPKQLLQAKKDRLFPVGQRVRGPYGRLATVTERRRSSFTARMDAGTGDNIIYEVFWPQWKPARYFWETDLPKSVLPLTDEQMKAVASGSLQRFVKTLLGDDYEKRTEAGGGGVQQAPESESGRGDAGAPGVQGPDADAPADAPARSVEGPGEVPEEAS